MKVDRIAIVGLAFVTTLVACGRDGTGPEPSDAPRLGATALRYELDERFGPIFFCDPDYYPVGSAEGERSNADEWWRTIDRDSEEVSTIFEHLEITEDPDEAQILAAYREHKRLLSIGLEPAGSTSRFDLRSGAEADAEQLTGTITDRGSIKIERTERADTACPICLAAKTLIDTPDGPLAVRDLRIGMPIWTTDRTGRQIRGRILRVVRREQEAPILLVRITLDDGRSVTASAAHPSADGRPLGSFARGEFLDGSVIVSIAVVAPGARATFDLLPSGPTGTYRAAGVLLGSTISKS